MIKANQLVTHGRSARIVGALVATMTLLACGGGGSTTAPSGSADSPTSGQNSSPVAKSLAGTVAVGAPMTGGLLKVLDALGNTVAEDVAVDENGRYSGLPLTGTGPWRLQACGHTGEVYQCLHSLAQDGGTANVTPLTDAMMVLALGESPSVFMTGARAPDQATLAAAQAQLRTGLAPVLLQVGLPSTLDLVTSDLSAGSRRGYDRVLDAIGVNLGEDDHPFVQISPRMGSGNLYLQPGQPTSGELAPAAQAQTLPLEGIETLFVAMSRALRSAQDCADPTQGLATLTASSAKLFQEEGSPVTGPAAVANLVCGMMGGGDGEPQRFGSRLTSPTLGRCDLTTEQPVCAVSFVLQSPDGEVEAIGEGMSVRYEAGSWKFNGELMSVPIHANTKVQRDVRIDGTTPVISYSRALAFDIPALPNLNCAHVTQTQADGNQRTVAFYKRHDSGSPRHLSVWRTTLDGASRSQDPNQGQTRSADDTWLMLPEGTQGDEVIRNFLRGGRQVNITLYSDNACVTPHEVDGRSTVTVDIHGIPPVWAQMASLPWPSLTEASALNLRTFAAAANSTTSLTALWRFERGQMGVREAVLCANRALCGEDGAGRLGEARIRPRTMRATLEVARGAQPLSAQHYKMLALYGQTFDGVGMQSNHMSCPNVSANQGCDE